MLNAKLHRLKRYGVIVFSIMIMAMAAAPINAAYAQDSACDEYDGLTNKIVSCIQDTIEEAGERFFDEVFIYFTVGVTAVLTLSVAIFGIMVATGSLERPSRDGMVYLMKLAAAGLIVGQMPYLHGMVISILEGLIDAVTSFISSNFSAPYCQSIETVWDRVDCMVDIIVGFENTQLSAGDGTTEEVAVPSLSKGLLGFLFMSLGGSMLGFAIAIVGLYVVFDLLFGIVKAIFMYLSALIALLFMAILGPIYLPLLLFRFTKQYFDAYIKIIVSLVLQPVIVFAYLVFMTVAMDSIIYSGDSSLMKTLAGDDFENAEYEVDGRFSISKWLELKNTEVVQNQLCGTRNQNQAVPLLDEGGPNIFADATNNEVDESTVATGMIGETSAAKKLTPAMVERDPSTGAIPFTTVKHSINWDCMTKLVSDGGDEMDKVVIIKMLTLAVMSMVFSSMLRYLPTLANDLAGGVNATPDLYGHASENNPLRAVTEPAANRATSTIRSGISQSISTLTGRR